jgi:hypothetical protein
VLAIAAHERTGSEGERTVAVIAAELDRYRARLEAVDLPQPRCRPAWPAPEWRQPARDNGIEKGM